ncbi:hypothetical protein N6H14_10630 [Paenibacillus sp. CC-CFT747]|nr:hypothetical protein N6H14_10630 [Paenibacillus sp. CC-CFT747]
MKDNRNHTLLPEEVQYASLIHSSGNDLLHLINDILDLSKVEAGKMEMHYGEVNVNELPFLMKRAFDPMARQKGLSFFVSRDADVPDIVYTDGQRLQQILKTFSRTPSSLPNRDRLRSGSVWPRNLGRFRPMRLAAASLAG